GELRCRSRYRQTEFVVGPSGQARVVSSRDLGSHRRASVRDESQMKVPALPQVVPDQEPRSKIRRRAPVDDRAHVRRIGDLEIVSADWNGIASLGEGTERATGTEPQLLCPPVEVDGRGTLMRADRCQVRLSR